MRSELLLVIVAVARNSCITVLRIFIARVAAGDKGSTAAAVSDLETVIGEIPLKSVGGVRYSSGTVGSYDDTILRRIDQLAVKAHARGIRTGSRSPFQS